jgi:hypothetical protein
VVRRASTFEWGDDYWGDFWRDPSNGGLNTNILASTGSTSNAEDWSLQANGTCGGTVTSTCPGGWLSANIRGFAIVTLRNIGQGSLCMGIDAANLWLAKMATCDGVNGQHHYDTLFVYVPGAACGSLRDTAFLSYQWNKNGDPGAGYVIDGSGSNSQVAVLKSADIPHCPESLWNPIAS